MFDSIFGSAATDTSITLSGLLAALGISFALGVVISFIYMKTHKTKAPSQSFAITLVMLPAVVTVIILLVGSNIARAFSLAGAFSIIRFRSAPGDAKDITYVLFTMAVGLAAGMGFLLYAAVITAMLCLVILILEIAGFGQVNSTEKILKIVIPENLDYQNAFDDIMQKYTMSSRLQKVKTADLGSLYELVYSVTTRSEAADKDFIDELTVKKDGKTLITFVSPSDCQYLAFSSPDIIKGESYDVYNGSSLAATITAGEGGSGMQGGGGGMKGGGRQGGGPGGQR